MVSSRAQELLRSEPFLVKAHFNCAQDAFDLMQNPGGYINLGTSENHLLWDVLAPKLNDVRCVDSKTTHYDHLFGSEQLRAAVAKFLQRHSNGTYIDPDSLVVTSGSTSAIEMLVYALCGPGDGVLIPAPYYAGFDFDLTARCGAVPVPVRLGGAGDFALKLEHVETAYWAAKKRGIVPRVLLITNPNNPLGCVYSQSLVQELIAFCETHELDCIFDEVYANSCFGDAKFTSSLAFANPVVHTVYSFAKDFALSGFKVGVAHSTTPSVLRAMRSLCHFSSVSTHTQHVLAQALSDDAWVADLVLRNATRLRRAYRFVTLALTRYGLPFVEANAGLFVFVDLRSKLRSRTFDAELELWRELFYDGKLNTSPGQIFQCEEPGFFRICFAHEEPVLRHAVVRLQNSVRRHLITGDTGRTVYTPGESRVR